MGLLARGSGPDRPEHFARSALAVGPEGSGTRAVALTLLAANGITAETARLLPLTGMDVVQSLRRRAVDTVFLVAGSGSPTVKAMLDLPGIALLSFPRADAYTKRFPSSPSWWQVAAATTVTSS